MMITVMIEDTLRMLFLAPFPLPITFLQLAIMHGLESILDLPKKADLKNAHGMPGMGPSMGLSHTSQNVM
jgi:hypothetical protein